MVENGNGVSISNFSLVPKGKTKFEFVSKKHSVDFIVRHF